jgi:hypothetical protein
LFGKARGKHFGKRIAQTGMAAATLKIVHADGRQEERSLTLGRYQVRSEAGDLVLYDSQVAAAVAMLDVSSSRIVIRDLGSTSGVFDQNGRRLAGSHELLPNDTVWIGGSRITWVVAASDSMPEKLGPSEPLPIVRGIVTRVPDSDFGRISIAGVSHTFLLDDVWQSNVDPRVNQIVDVEFDAQYRIVSVLVVPDQAGAWHELVRERRRKSTPPARRSRPPERQPSPSGAKSCIVPRACGPLRAAWEAVATRFGYRRR